MTRPLTKDSSLFALARTGMRTHCLNMSLAEGGVCRSQLPGRVAAVFTWKCPEGSRRI